MHIAMWSGPRNLSTALMYSFAARSDFEVRDEPFYGAYLRMTGLDHPMRDEILESMNDDPTKVASGFEDYETPFLFTKQMTQHMIDGIRDDWLPTARHAFLIRHPARVVASYIAKREEPTLDDLGFVQQKRILDTVTSLGHAPVVVDSFDIRRAPEATLKQLCEKLNLVWDPAMLSWPKGGNVADGIWAQHWYGAVHDSTGFAEPEGPLPDLTGHASRIADQAMPYYDELRALI